MPRPVVLIALVALVPALAGCASSPAGSTPESCARLSLAAGPDAARSDFASGVLALNLTFSNAGGEAVHVLPFRDPLSGSLEVTNASSGATVPRGRPPEAPSGPWVRDADLREVPGGGAHVERVVDAGGWRLAAGARYEVGVTYAYLDSADPGEVTRAFCGGPLRARAAFVA